MMGEMTDYTNMAQAFAYMPVVWSVGATIGYVVCFISIHTLILLDNIVDHLLVGNFPGRRTVFHICLVHIFGRCILIFSHVW